ncbi:glycosyl hydrolase family 18 protein, partial [Candidatus Neomarinimicrobiota bacterium]
MIARVRQPIITLTILLLAIGFLYAQDFVPTHVRELEEHYNAVMDIIGIDRGWLSSAVVPFAHQRGVKVKLCATLFGSSKLETFLSNPIYRERAITKLLQLVKSKRADGVDIDFELLPSSQRENLVTFMQNLTWAFHNGIPGSIVTMATPAVDWSGAWDYDALADIVDGLFIMGYDYHWGGSSNAGPVSPLDGFSRTVRWSVDDYLAKTGGKSDKIILGLPYYGYDWPVLKEQKYASTLGQGTARLYTQASPMAQSSGYRWDNNSSTPWFNYLTGTTYHQVWWDDSLSLSLKYDLALENNLGGVGMWALGYDEGHTELWGALSDHFLVSHTAPPQKPSGLIALNNTDGSITVSVPQVAYTDSYHVYITTDGNTYTHHAASNRPALTMTDLPWDQPVYLTVTASN